MSASPTEPSATTAIPSAERGGPAAPPIPRCRRILVADDDESVRRMLEACLGRSGLDVTVETVGDGQAACAAARLFLPDLVVVDLLMPGLDGAGVCRWLRTNGSADVKVLVITGNPTSDLLRQAMEAGADGWVKKPFSLADFLAKVGGLLNAGAPAVGGPGVLAAPPASGQLSVGR